MYALNQGTVFTINQVRVATGVIVTRGVGNHGVWAENTNENSDAWVRAENDGSGASITTEGDNAHGVYARNEGIGQVEALNVDGASITTMGDDAHGVYAYNTGGTMDAPNTGGVKAFNIGTVTVASGSYGVYGLNEGVISTTDIHGVWAENTNENSDISVKAESIGSGASITTMGDGAHGLYASTTYGTGRVEAINDAGSCTQAGGTTPRACIQTSGDSAHGIYARTDGTGGVNIQNSGTITTMGTAAHGMFAHNTGGTTDARNTGGVKALSSGTMEVTGTDAYGVYAFNEGGVIETTDIHGVWAENTNADSDTSVRAENRDPSSPGTDSTLIITTGENGYGLYARSTGGGDVSAANTAIANAQSDINVQFSAFSTSRITTNSDNAYGVYAEGSGDGETTAINQATATATATAIPNDLRNTSSYVFSVAGTILVTAIDVNDVDALARVLAISLSTTPLTDITSALRALSDVTKTNSIAALVQQRLIQIATAIANNQDTEAAVTALANALRETGRSLAIANIINLDGDTNLNDNALAAAIRTHAEDIADIIVTAIKTTSATSTSIITTSGDGAHGVYAKGTGGGRVLAQNLTTATASDQNSLTAQATSTSMITTSGAGAHGVFAHNTGGTSSTPNTGGVRASNSGTIEVTGTDAYGVYALNEGGVISTTDIHGVWAENTNTDSDTSVRVRRMMVAERVSPRWVMMHMDYMRALLVQVR